LEPEVAREFHELMAADLSVPLKLLEDELHINWNMICQILHDWKRGRSAWSLYHTASQIIKMSTE